MSCLKSPTVTWTHVTVCRPLNLKQGPTVWSINIHNIKVQISLGLLTCLWISLIATHTVQVHNMSISNAVNSPAGDLWNDVDTLHRRAALAFPWLTMPINNYFNLNFNYDGHVRTCRVWPTRPTASATVWSQMNWNNLPCDRVIQSKTMCHTVKSCELRGLQYAILCCSRSTFSVYFLRQLPKNI